MIARLLAHTVHWIALLCVGLALIGLADPPITALATPSAQVAIRGYLTTPAELATIRRRATSNVEPYATTVAEFHNLAWLATPHYWVGPTRFRGAPVCSDGSHQDANGRRIPRGPYYLIEGGRMTYAKALAVHLHEGALAEAFARDARRRILELTYTHTWGGENYSGSNQCILYLSWYISGFIMAADLLEPFPQIWTATDKRAFQRWLAAEVYPKVAWASRMRTNNWGSGGSYAAAMIGDYLNGSELMLTEVAPEVRTLSPIDAYMVHTGEQRSRMRTTIAERDQRDSQCLPFKGIQPGGGIPDELRRARIEEPTSMCSATYLPSITGPYRSAYGYQMTHIEALIAHAEMALRRGDSSLYDNQAPDRSGSLLRAIKFIVANPSNPRASYDWDYYSKAQLFVAYRYYRDPALEAQLETGTLRGGDIITYGRLTHARLPAPMPTASPLPTAPTRP